MKELNNSAGGPFALDIIESVHKREIKIGIHKCCGDMWLIQGHLQDIRGRDVPLWDGGVRRAGTPLHEITARLAVDPTLTILAADANIAAAPIPGICEGIAPDYSRLKGVCITAGFRRELGRLFGGLKGCAHITELIVSMASVAVQAVGSETEKATDAEKPRKLDACHALDTTGPVVKCLYPKWYRGTLDVRVEN